MGDSKQGLKQRDPKGVNPTGRGPAQPTRKESEEAKKGAMSGAASAGPTAAADEDTYD